MQSFVFGQPWLKQALPASKQQAHKPNFFDVQEKFKAYWDNRSASLREEENAEEENGEEENGEEENNEEENTEENEQ